jgi:hypothetical protein
MGAPVASATGLVSLSPPSSQGKAAVGGLQASAGPSSGPAKGGLYRGVPTPVNSRKTLGPGLDWGRIRPLGLDGDPPAQRELLWGRPQETLATRLFPKATLLRIDGDDDPIEPLRGWLEEKITFWNTTANWLSRR